MAEHLNFVAKARAKARPKNRPNIGTKRSCPTEARSRKARRNSIDGTFVVPDHVVHLDTDHSPPNTETSESTSKGSDRDAEMARAIHENVDLRIDMQAKYAYNAKVLGQRKKG